MASAERAARTFVTRTSEATEALGEALGRALDGGLVIALDGDLASGKTTFVRGLARGLDVADPVASPTYALLQSHPGRLRLDHLDAWMEGRERAFLLDGGLEWIQEDAVAAIEWAARVADLLPQPRLAVALEHEGPGARRITLAVVGDPRSGGGQRIARAIAALAPPADAREDPARSRAG